MPDGPVIANNTPLASLWAVDRLDLLEDLFGEVVIPGEVASEFLAGGPAVRSGELTRASWLRIEQVSDRRRVLAFSALDLGEAEVLALAEETQARLLIIDESKGRLFARRLGFSVTGTLGILLLAKERALVERVGPVISDLQRAGLFLSQRLVEEVLAMAGE